MNGLFGRILPFFPLFFVLLLYAYVGHTFALPLGLLVLLVLCAIVGPRLPVDRATQRVFGIVAAVLSVAITRASLDLEETRLLAAFWVGLIVAAALIVGFRALCRVPDGGIRGTITIELVALIAVGETHIGVLYPFTVVSFLASALFVLRSADPHRPPLPAISSRSRKIAFAIMSATLPIAFVLAAPARPLANYVHRKLEGVFENVYENRASTFNDGMRIGKLSRALRSNTVAVRIYGPKPELLRTVVFDTYNNGLFSHSQAPDPDALVETRRGPLDGADVAYAMRGGRETDRFFLPLGATDVATGAGQIRHEAFGVLRGTSPDATKRYWYRVPRPDMRVQDAGAAADLELPESLRPALRNLADQWTLGAVADDEVLLRIETHLRTEFSYALDRDHSKAADPVLHFLYRDRSGHCEYFAAAMTLLARSKGIPARYVAGYRVSEQNPIDGHYIVREKNAHSWVEARILGQGWKTFDPTPMAEQPATSNSDAGLDFVASLWNRAEAWLVDRTLTELTIAAALGTLLFALVRFWRNRHAKAIELDEADVPVAGPLPFLADFLTELRNAGFPRTKFTPLERFARSLPDETAKALLLRYAAHRYGAVADEDLVHAMKTHTATLRSRAAPAASGAEPRKNE